MPSSSMTTTTRSAHPSGASFIIKAEPDSSPIPALPLSSKKRERKRTHLCQSCEKSFTTSGHLARHVRIHTGERKHACPFPGCGMRCSRKDNLKQHYRTHMSASPRRSSRRSDSIQNSASTTRRGSKPTLDVILPLSVSPQPPRLYHISDPPRTPPPLAHANPLMMTVSTAVSGRGHSPLPPYTESDRHSTSSLPMHYLPRSHYSSSGDMIHYTGAYTDTHSTLNHPNLPPIDTTVSQHCDENSPISSRHLVSHISPTYSLTSHYSTYSIASSSSDPTSSPPTSYPSYHSYLDEEPTSYSHNASFVDNRAHITASPAASYSSASSDSMHIPTRYQSPAPVLAPLQDVYRRECRSLEVLGNGSYSVRHPGMSSHAHSHSHSSPLNYLQNGCESPHSIDPIHRIREMATMVQT